MPEGGKCRSIGYAILSGPVEVDEEREATAVWNSEAEKGEQKEE